MTTSPNKHLPKTLSEALLHHMRDLGRRGGKAGVGKCKARSSEVARASALAGWIKRRANKQTKETTV